MSKLVALKNGDALYGKFWLLQEYFYTAQINKDEVKNTIRIIESELTRVLKCNARSLGKVLETFRECLGIVSERFPERFGNFYETTIPNALMYLRNRNVKNDNKIKSKIKLKGSVENLTTVSPEKDGLGSMGDASREAARILKEKTKTKGRD